MGRISTHTPVRVWLIIVGLLRLLSRFQLTHPWGCDATCILHLYFLIWFQLTHPWGCDGYRYSKSISASRFQLTHPWGCDSGCRISNYFYWYFNSHTREGVTMLWKHSIKTGYFNSHTREGVTIIICAIFNTLRFQLTHPWGCDCPLPNIIRKLWFISTHTPVRVWLTLADIWEILYDFNSHTREGVTAYLLFFALFARFQLTHPWGCDDDTLSYYECLCISTHTPVRVWHCTS